MARQRVKLNDIGEYFVQVFRPVVRGEFMHFDLDRHRVAGFRVLARGAAAQTCTSYSVKSGATLTPAPRQRDADGFEDRRLTCVVRPNQNGRRAEFYLGVLDGPGIQLLTYFPVSAAARVGSASAKTYLWTVVPPTGLFDRRDPVWHAPEPIPEPCYPNPR